MIAVNVGAGGVRDNDDSDLQCCTRRGRNVSNDELRSFPGCASAVAQLLIIPQHE
jgi:hypothetical protein